MVLTAIAQSIVRTLLWNETGTTMMFHNIVYKLLRSVAITSLAGVCRLYILTTESNKQRISGILTQLYNNFSETLQFFVNLEY